MVYSTLAKRLYHVYVHDPGKTERDRHGECVNRACKHCTSACMTLCVRVDIFARLLTSVAVGLFAHLCFCKRGSYKQQTVDSRRKVKKRKTKNTLFPHETIKGITLNSCYDAICPLRVQECRTLME